MQKFPAIKGNLGFFQFQMCHLKWKLILSNICLGPAPDQDLDQDHAVAGPGHAPDHVTVNPGIIKDNKVQSEQDFPGVLVIYLFTSKYLNRAFFL